MLLALVRSLSAFASPSASISVGVVGGGLAGVTAARKVASAGVPVTIYERDGRLGGRLGTIPLPLTNGVEGATVEVGLGCSYIKADDERFHLQLQKWERQGIVTRWESWPHILGASGAFEPMSMNPEEVWYCGSPSMSAPAFLTSHERGQIEVYHAAVTQAVHSPSNKWSLQHESEELATTFSTSEHDALILAVPISEAEDIMSSPAEKLLFDNLLPGGTVVRACICHFCCTGSLGAEGDCQALTRLTLAPHRGGTSA